MMIFKWCQENILRTFFVLAVVWALGVTVQGLLAGYDLTFLKADYQLSGTFGDSFGGLSAFMATAAAIGAWQAVAHQRKELENVGARESELDASAAKRDFEATFFRLMSTFQGVESEIRVNSFLKASIGKQAFDEMRISFNKIIERPKTDRNVAYREFFEEYRYNLAHYFRSIYNLVAFAERIRPKDCYFYIKMVRSTLSESELIMIALNGMYHPEGKVNFLPLIESYSLLDNVSSEDQVYYDLKSVYKDVAFDSALRLC